MKNVYLFLSKNYSHILFWVFLGLAYCFDIIFLFGVAVYFGLINIAKTLGQAIGEEIKEKLGNK